MSQFPGCAYFIVGFYGNQFLMLQVLKKLDMIRKNDIERILEERNILITVRNPFVVTFK